MLGKFIFALKELMWRMVVERLAIWGDRAVIATGVIRCWLTSAQVYSTCLFKGSAAPLRYDRRENYSYD